MDHARGKRAIKRGGGGKRFSIAEGDRFVRPDPDSLLDLAAALDRLAAEDSDAADVARCRLFAGLTIGEITEALGLSRASAYREWTYARAWLTAALAAEPRTN